MEVKNITVFGKNYVSTPTVDECSGCAFNSNPHSCNIANGQFGCDGGLGGTVIWKEESAQHATNSNLATQVTYTEDQIRFGLKQWYGFDDSIDFLNAMKKYSDPDYARYIELKEKFNE